MIVLAVKIRCKPEKVREAKAFFSSFPARARTEKGCIAYELFEGRDDPQIFYFFEKWASQEDFDAHGRQDYLVEFHSRFGELLACPNELLYLTEM